jgi:hypothetical protein
MSTHAKRTTGHSAVVHTDPSGLLQLRLSMTVHIVAVHTVVVHTVVVPTLSKKEILLFFLMLSLTGMLTGERDGRATY